MKRILLIISLVLIAAPSIYAQNNHTEKLKESVVKIEGSNWSVQEFGMLLFGEANLQIETSARCPQSVISRDNFVAFYSSIVTMIFIQMFEREGMTVDDMKIQDLDELIGEADIKVHLEMTKNGIQFQVTTIDGVERYTQTWDQIYGGQ